MERANTMDVQLKLKEFFVEDDNKLKVFDNSIRTVLMEGGWKKEDADSAVLWIKKTLGLQTSVLSGV